MPAVEACCCNRYCNLREIYVAANMRTAFHGRSVQRCATNADRTNRIGCLSHAEATGANACVSRHVRFAYEFLIALGGSTHQSSWVGIASMDGSEESL